MPRGSITSLPWGNLLVSLILLALGWLLLRARGVRREAPYGELINIHYTARFDDGMVFDSSNKRARPLTMRIGVGKVIKELDQGILGGEGVSPMNEVNLDDIVVSYCLTF